MLICAAGDCHGNLSALYEAVRTMERQVERQVDLVLQVGDLGAWRESFTPLIPLPEHVVQPARQKANPGDLGYLLPEPPPVSTIIPDSIPITIEVPLPEPLDMVMDPFKIEPRQ